MEGIEEGIEGVILVVDATDWEAETSLSYHITLSTAIL